MKSIGKNNADSIIANIFIVGTVGNIVLSIFKLLSGILGNSAAMIADSIHSFSDIVSTIIAFIGVKLSKIKADTNHPYGHDRIECLASLILGILLFITGLSIGKVGLDTIISHRYTATPKKIALVAAVVSIVSKEIMFRYTMHFAKIINSPAFIADAWHHRSDALSSIGAFIGILGSMLGFPVLDSVSSIVICGFIIKVAYDILKNAINNMLDTSCDEKLEKELLEYIKSQNDVYSIDTFKTRLFGSKVYVDLEIQVDGNKTLREAHEVAERIHNNIENDFPNIKHIMIHMNPAEV